MFVGSLRMDTKLNIVIITTLNVHSKRTFKATYGN